MGEMIIIPERHDGETGQKVSRWLELADVALHLQRQIKDSILHFKWRSKREHEKLEQEVRAAADAVRAELQERTG